MTIEQIISLLQICGYILAIPTVALLVAGIVTCIRWKNGSWVPTEPGHHKSVIQATAEVRKEIAEPSADPPLTTEVNSQRNRKRKQKSARPQEQIHIPTVKTVVPEDAENALAELWSRFPDITADWNILFRQEE